MRHPDGLEPDDDSQDGILTEVFATWDEIPPDYEYASVEAEVTPASRALDLTQIIINPHVGGLPARIRGQHQERRDPAQWDFVLALVTLLMIGPFLLFGAVCLLMALTQV